VFDKNFIILSQNMYQRLAKRYTATNTNLLTAKNLMNSRIEKNAQYLFDEIFAAVARTTPTIC